MKVGVFGGSFDPIHNGHISLAKYVLDHTDLDEVWLMVSPLNPLKPNGYIATDEQRLEMARLAVEGVPGVKVSDFEFTLPIPSYTYNTMTKLKEAYPDTDFRLIIGGDNWVHFDRWRNPQEILDQFGIIVYPRPGEEISTYSNSQLTINDSSLTIMQGAPEMPVSSTRIRTFLKTGDSPDLVGTHGSCVRVYPISDFIPEKVLNYIRSRHLYTTAKGSAAE
ncbi:MAG: nicotinate (nicotinamide) nucleotide adenylyltransferase [Muribaculaceae bacterium]|nr:nicotinate (nicotinamide) nucleotide adenylyltransferase [Muribaculaceae bacterium]